jgi:hypothetical protein
MVGEVKPTSSIHHARQIEAMRRGLGTLASPAASDATGRVTPLTLIHSKAPTPAGSFPLGAQTRRIDECMRLKFAPNGVTMAELLGWEPGALDAVCHDGWLMLSQDPERVRPRRGYHSAFARFSVASNGTSRISLSHAHLDNLGVGAGHDVLVAVLPDASRVLVIDPVRILDSAPGPVLAQLPQRGAAVERPPVVDPLLPTAQGEAR